MMSGMGRMKILPVIGLVLLAGGLARGVTSLTGESAAYGAQDALPPAPASSDALETGAARSPQPVPGAASDTGTDDRLALRYAEAREALDRRARDLDTREKALAVIEARLEARAAALAEERAALTDLRTGRDEARAEEFENLANAYERMKAREAARIFEVLGDDILVPVAARMRTQALAGVLAEMTPARAQDLTRKLALRTSDSKPGEDRGAAHTISGGSGSPDRNVRRSGATTPVPSSGTSPAPTGVPRPTIGPAQ